MTEETNITYIITDLCKLSFNLEMPTSNFFDKLNEIGDAGIASNFERLSERVRVTLGKLSLPSLNETTIVRELWSRDTPLPISELTDDQQAEYVRQILLTPEKLTEEITGILEDVLRKHCQISRFNLLEHFSVEDIIEELTNAPGVSTADILIELARAI